MDDDFNLLAELRRYLRCAICDKRVGRVEKNYRPMDMTIVYDVYCHGAKESVEFRLGDLELAAVRNISIEPAFGGRLLGAAP